MPNCDGAGAVARLQGEADGVERDRCDAGPRVGERFKSKRQFDSLSNQDGHVIRSSRIAAKNDFLVDPLQTFADDLNR